MKPKKFLSIFILVLTFSICFSDVEVKVNINLKSPPPVKVKPALVVIPDTKVMYVSNFDDFEIFYFDGFYFCYYDGVWWRTRTFSEPWVKIDIKYVPAAIIKIPPGWREKVKVKYKHQKHHEKNKEIIIITPKKGKKK